MRRSAAILALLAFVLVPTPVAANVPAGSSGAKRSSTYNELTAELKGVAEAHGDIANLVSMGTVTRAELVVLKISDHAPIDEAEPEVLLTGLIHAREHLDGGARTWPSSTGWWTIRGPQVRAIVNATEIWVAPMLNPDGGQYDIRGGTYRNWRKNRQPTPGSPYTGTRPEPQLRLPLGMLRWLQRQPSGHHVPRLGQVQRAGECRLPPVRAVSTRRGRPTAPTGHQLPQLRPGDPLPFGYTREPVRPHAAR